MLSKILRKSKATTPDLFMSKLLDEATFFPAFPKDLENCRSEAIIESPFVMEASICSGVNWSGQPIPIYPGRR
jgi:hypothetical protein